MFTVEHTDGSCFYPGHRNLDELARLADKIMEMAIPYPAIATVITISELCYISQMLIELPSRHLKSVPRKKPFRYLLSLTCILPL